MERVIYPILSVLLFLLLAWILMPVRLAEGGEGHPPRSLFADHRAHRVGDVLMVLILEQATASSEAKTSAQKEGDHSLSAPAGSGPLSFIPLMGGSLKNKTSHSGDAQTSRRGSLRAQMTVQVVDITELGHLVVEGHRMVDLNGAKEEIVLSGTVRPEDVQADNTVYSYHIANAKITYKGKGALQRAQRAGLLSWLLGWLF